MPPSSEMGKLVRLQWGLYLLLSELDDDASINLTDFTVNNLLDTIKETANGLAEEIDADR